MLQKKSRHLYKGQSRFAGWGSSFKSKDLIKTASRATAHANWHTPARRSGNEGTTRRATRAGKRARWLAQHRPATPPQHATGADAGWGAGPGPRGAGGGAGGAGPVGVAVRAARADRGALHSVSDSPARGAMKRRTVGFIRVLHYASGTLAGGGPAAWCLGSPARAARAPDAPTRTTQSTHLAQLTPAAAREANGLRPPLCPMRHAALSKTLCTE